MAVGWGGLVAAIGLLVAAERDTLMRVVIVALAFAFGGFLAGVRAGEWRPVHGALAAVAAFAFHALFVLVGSLVDLVGGPDAPPFAPGEDSAWLWTALLAVLCGLAGATTAALWLRPQRSGRRRRVA